MRFSFASALVVALAVEVTASGWFSKAVYNKWHETELERWLSDHDIPYPTPADRKDLENLVKSNWNSAIESPYANWDTARLQRYLTDRGQEVKKGTAQNKDALVSQVKGTWYDAEGTASNAYSDVKSWIFDSWTDSSLKAFCDKHGIPVPQPRTRDALLKTARENYQTVANKAGETAAYPGNWLYQSWSDSELKAWLDERGIPVPQTKRDKLVATVRRNAYIASRNAADARDRAAEATFNAWSDSELKSWADKNGIKVPQGSNRNELLAIARKNIAKLTGDNVSYSASSAASRASASASSAYGAATTKAGNEFAKASDQASVHADNLYAKASSVVVSIYTEVQIALGLKTNYLSSASKSLSSVSAKASAKAEL